METETQVVSTPKVGYWLMPGFKVRTLSSEICKAFRIPEKDLFSKTRKREICNARQVYIYVIMTTNIPASKYAGSDEINQLIARKSPTAMSKHTGWDHATMIHCRDIAVPNFIDTEKEIRDLIHNLITGLISGYITMPDVTKPHAEYHEDN